MYSFQLFREHETKFLVRTLVSNLRVGANWRSVIGAMARAVVLHREGSRVSKARLDAAATAASEAFHVSVTTAGSIVISSETVCMNDALVTIKLCSPSSSGCLHVSLACGVAVLRSKMVC